MTNKSRQERLKFFFDFFEERIRFVENNCLDKIEGLILICCYLDSLAGFKYGGRSSRKRFKKFILSYSELEHVWRKISLPLLKQHLEKKNHEFYKPFIKYLEDKLGVRRREYTNLSYNVDVDLQTIHDKAKGVLDDKYLLQLQDELTDFEYISILWKDYRNSAVHRTSSKKDKAFPLGEKSEPYYVNYTIIDDNTVHKEETRFDIPQQFILQTLKRCLNNLRDECVKADIDPLDFKGAGEDSDSRSTDRTKTEENDVGYPRLITKPMRFILRDAEHSLQQAKMCQENFSKTHDFKYRELESSYSRACLLFCVVFLEGLANNILKDFQIVREDQIPEVLKRKCGLNQQELATASLETKIYLIPYLCNESPRFEQEYFYRGSKEFQELRELIRIRNSYVHPRPIRRKLEIKMTTDRKFLVYDEFPQNFWPLTKIPKDIFIFEYKHAEKAKWITDEIFQNLNNFLQERLTKDNWLINEKIEFDPTKNP